MVLAMGKFSVQVLQFNGVWVEEVSPMTILSLGYKQHLGSGLSVKGGVGYGWCKYAAFPRLEITVRWTFGL